jgi:hypothetical protein
MENKETLEEAAEKYAKTAEGIDIPYQNGLYYGFVDGAKWQAERMYSEEDLKKAFIAGGNSQIEEDDGYGSRYLKYMEDWFQKFKKK